MASYNEPGFARALLLFLSGSTQIQTFCRPVVEAAVSEVLLRVSLEYGLDYDAVVRAHAHVVVDETLVVRVGDSTVMCRGTTGRGEPCTTRAAVGDYCMRHLGQLREEEAKRRRVDAYSTRVQLARRMATTGTNALDECKSIAKHEGVE